MYATNPKYVDLDRDYSPSMHTKRFQEHEQPDIAMVEHSIKLITQQTNDLTTKLGISLRANLRYGGTDDRQLVDVYYRGEESATPLFVYVHGGYWQLLDKSCAGSFVAPLVARGYRVAVMGYNLCPQVTLTELLQQFTDFLRWIFDYAAQTNTSEIVFAGHSAGAHMLTLLLNYSPLATKKHVQLIKGIFLISGVYDLRELWSLKAVNPDNILSVDSSNAAELSPLCWSYGCLDAYKQHQTPVHVLVAEHDSETFIGQSLALTKFYKKLGLNVYYKMFEDYDHYNIIEEAAVEGTKIISYISQALGCPQMFTPQ